MNVVHNERVKIAAAALNTAATSCFTVGIATPLAAVFYNIGGVGAAVPLSKLFVGVGLWLFAAVVLHWGAQRLLGRLRS